MLVGVYAKAPVTRVGGTSIAVTSIACVREVAAGLVEERAEFAYSAVAVDKAEFAHTYFADDDLYRSSPAAAYVSRFEVVAQKRLRVGHVVAVGYRQNAVVRKGDFVGGIVERLPAMAVFNADSAVCGYPRMYHHRGCAGVEGRGQSAVFVNKPLCAHGLIGLHHAPGVIGKGEAVGVVVDAVCYSLYGWEFSPFGLQY